MLCAPLFAAAIPEVWPSVPMGHLALLTVCGEVAIALFWVAFIKLFGSASGNGRSVDMGRSVFIFGGIAIYALAFVALAAGYFG